ncbi:MAG TPA: phosphoenolpyruvate kinase [Flavobacteriales bacterium]|nr:phosphoenolpyruvate kinase [Flavobacteriales bacterium]HIN40597.1 phosphoenolpyruvate kinase [Flavobacteriales bacterium]
MKTSIDQGKRDEILNELGSANKIFSRFYPGDRTDRQPVHTVYGGAQLFKSETIRKMGQTAESHFWAYAPDASILANALKLSGSIDFCEKIYQKILNKLETEAVEDFRIDFEDGFGNRPDEEEDRTAEFTAKELAKGMKNDFLSPYIGIRIKPFSEELKNRGARTLDIFLTTLSELTKGELPPNFVVTIPKVTIPEQVKALVDLFKELEANTEIKPGSLKFEIMIETTQSIFNPNGESNLRNLIQAGEGRCIAAHFGTYDYTASCNITAKYQTMDHPVCDFAHHMMKVTLAGTGIWISDGATNIMPIPPNRGSSITEAQKAENRDVVHQAWKIAYDHIRHSLLHGFYQGWDLHPAQLAIRYAAVYSFFLESYSEAAIRLKNFVGKAAQATLVGDVFDDAATGQGLLNYFLAALNCGAISEEEVKVTGLSMDEIRTRSFLKILEGRK